MESEPLFVEVVSATKRVWEGDAVSVIARTTTTRCAPAAAACAVSAQEQVVNLYSARH